jgi:hypothetical protein
VKKRPTKEMRVRKTKKACENKRLKEKKTTDQVN